MRSSSTTRIRATVMVLSSASVGWMEREGDAERRSATPVDLHSPFQLVHQHRHQLQPERLDPTQVQAGGQAYPVVRNRQEEFPLGGGAQSDPNPPAGSAPEGVLETVRDQFVDQQPA